MKPTRIAAILMLSFLFGGSSAEMAVQTHRAIERHRAAQEEGSGGELVALEIQRDDGEVLARPRVIAAPGRVAHLVLRDPEQPDRIRLSLRVATTREASGTLALGYELDMPSEDLACGGVVSVSLGVEQKLDVGDRPLIATVLALPVPSPAFEEFLRAQRAARFGPHPI
jgi:hypothetical protein